MAINFLNHVDLNRNEIQNPQLIKAQVDNQINDAAVGGTPVEGQLYFNTTIDALKVYANGAWAEVGATSGVETFTNANGTFVSAATVNTGAIGNVTTGVIDLSATGTASAGTYLRGDNTWAAVPQGDITAVLQGTYINVDNSTGPAPTVNHNLTTRIDTSSTASPAHGATFTAVDSVATNTTGHITALNLKTVTLPADNNDNTIYLLSTAATGIVTLDASAGTDTSVKFIGTANEIDTHITTGANGIVQIGLPDDVTIVNNLTVGGTGNFTGQVTIPLTPTSAANAASKSYVDASNIGQSIFQGGYNAATNYPDLDGAPSSLIKKGWFWAVTATGDFFAEEVQPGDLIYANQDNPGATYANWTVVQSGQDIAGAGATDGATTKGVSGFNSAHFNVTANGWVSSDIYGGASTLGIVPSGGTNTKFLRGDGTWEVPTNTEGITSVVHSTNVTLQGTNVTTSGSVATVGLSIDGMTTNATLPDPLETFIAYTDDTNGYNYKASFGDLLVEANSSTSKTGVIAIGSLSGTVTHTFGKNTMVQTVDATSGDTVYCDVTRTGTTCVATINSASATTITILVQKIG